MSWLEILSYVVTILGFPTAIAVFIYEERKRRENEENELHRNLSAEYDSFLKLVLEHSDLLLMRKAVPASELSDEQRERKEILLRMLVALFEKAYIILHSKNLSKDAARRWGSWEDYIREWCRRSDFREFLPELLEGEDEEFTSYLLAIVALSEQRHDDAG